VKPIIFTLPLQTTNPQNGAQGMSRAAALHKAKVRKEHRHLAFLLVRAFLMGAPEVFLAGSVNAAIKGVPIAVTLTRESAGVLDTDGLAAALKSVRDGVADALGIDDGDTARLEFRYAQRKCARGRYAVECKIERAR
jgi:hypothetical protein